MRVIFGKMFRKPLSNFLVFISKGPCVSVFRTCISKATIPPCRLTCPCRRCMARSTSRALGMLSPLCRRWSSGPRVLCLSCAPSSIQRPFLPGVFSFFFVFGSPNICSMVFCWYLPTLESPHLHQVNCSSFCCFLWPSDAKETDPGRIPSHCEIGWDRLGRLETFLLIFRLCAGFVSKAVSISAYSWTRTRRQLWCINWKRDWRFVAMQILSMWFYE